MKGVVAFTVQDGFLSKGKNRGSAFEAFVQSNCRPDQAEAIMRQAAYIYIYGVVCC